MHTLREAYVLDFINTLKACPFRLELGPKCSLSNALNVLIEVVAYRREKFQ